MSCLVCLVTRNLKKIFWASAPCWNGRFKDSEWFLLANELPSIRGEEGMLATNFSTRLIGEWTRVISTERKEKLRKVAFDQGLEGQEGSQNSWGRASHPSHTPQSLPIAHPCLTPHSFSPTDPTHSTQTSLESKFSTEQFRNPILLNASISHEETEAHGVFPM